jgi:hypothetical protein
MRITILIINWLMLALAVLGLLFSLQDPDYASAVVGVVLISIMTVPTILYVRKTDLTIEYLEDDIWNLENEIRSLKE